MQYHLWRLVTALAQRLPLRLSYTIAAAAGTAAFYVWPRGRRATISNFSRVLPDAGEASVRRVARRSIANYCKYLVDFVRFSGMNQDALISHSRSNGHYEKLAEVMARAKGVVIVCMHFGNWDLGAGACAARGLPVGVVVESFGDKRLDRMIGGAREAAGMTLLAIESAGPSLARTLKHGSGLALLIDRPLTENEGVEVTFFGERVRVPAGPARLALMTGAAVMTAGFARMARNGPEVSTFATFDFAPEPTGDRQEDVRALTQAIMDEHEKIIRRFPTQWYMFREMWPATESTV